jgi:hypothetical protein
MFKTLLLTAEGYTGSKVLSINFARKRTIEPQTDGIGLPHHQPKGLDRPIADYEDEEQFAASPTQAVILLQPAANPLPMLVFLIATQKTKATRTTINVYSTKP